MSCITSNEKLTKLKRTETFSFLLKHLKITTIIYIFIYTCSRSEEGILVWFPVFNDYMTQVMMFRNLKRNMVASNSNFLILSIRCSWKCQQKFLSFGCKDIGIKKSKFMAKTQFLWFFDRIIFSNGHLVFCLDCGLKMAYLMVSQRKKEVYSCRES